MWTEREIVGLLRRLAAGGPANAVLGIGDDAAILRLPPGHDLLVTTDLFVEGVHFRRDWLRAAAAGKRALCRGLSDIAAMGGRPRWVFLSLALPRRCPPAWVRDFFRGFTGAARGFRVALAGGDTGASAGEGMLADVLAIGSAPKGTALRRSGARPGDVLFVSGRLGVTATALAARKPLPPIRPRLALGDYLRRFRLASAAIDLSDGLSTDLNHLASESGVAAEVRADRIPGAGHLQHALHGGEDYELLFSVPSSKAPRLHGHRAGVRLTPIGRIVEGSGVTLVHRDGRREALSPAGWEHRG